MENEEVNLSATVFPGLPNSLRNGSVMMFDLVKEKRFKTMGNQTVVWSVVSPALRIGEHIEDMVGHVHAYGLSSANFKYQVRCRFSYDGVHWPETDSVAILGVTTADETYTITSAVTDRTKFGRFVRFEVGVSDTNAVECGFLSVSVAVKFWRR